LVFFAVSIGLSKEFIGDWLPVSFIGKQCARVRLHPPIVKSIELSNQSAITDDTKLRAGFGQRRRFATRRSEFDTAVTSETVKQRLEAEGRKLR
jgi:hypothetical protein